MKKIDITRILWMNLAKDENKFIRTLARVRQGVQNVISYKQIEEMIFTQQIPVEVIDAVQKEYAKWLANDLKEYYKKYTKEGIQKIAEAFQRKLNYDKVLVYVDKWILERGANLVTKICEDQRLTLRAILHKFVIEEPKSPEELSHYIRSVVGLTERQTNALLKMRDALLEQGLPENKINKIIAKQAKDMHIFRARMIARTELSFAYNRGTLAEMEDIVTEYQFEQVEKIWITAPDEFVCEDCARMNGTRISLDNEFQSPAAKGNEPLLTPPLHPNCRCSLVYEVR